MKVVVPKQQEQEVAYVSTMRFDDVTDILLIGNAESSVRVVNNFTRSIEHPNRESLPLFSLSEYRPAVREKVVDKTAQAFSLTTAPTDAE